MSKCVRWYRNQDNTSQLALSEEGIWYSRSFADTYYGKVWTKWRNMKKLEKVYHKEGRIYFIFEIDYTDYEYIPEHNSKAPNKFRLP